MKCFKRSLYGGDMTTLNSSVYFTSTTGEIIGED